MTVSEFGDLTVRPLSGVEEVSLFCQLPYTLNDEVAVDLEEGRRRPEWLWVALRGGRLVARAGWWALRQGGEPFVLDIFDIDDAEEAADRVDIGIALLETAMTTMFPGSGTTPSETQERPEYSRFVPPGWREDPEQRRAVGDRTAALERTGARPLVERLRLQWLAGGPVPAPTGRLAFRQVEDRDELVGLMARVLEGTLDEHSRSELITMSAEEQAAKQYEDELALYKSPRAWWRIATLPDGGPVGFVIPARNAYGPIIAYIGVLPEHRGHGYIDDVLAEGTRVLAAEGARRIRASTDLGNTPMAAAFERAGYPAFEHQITMVWD